METFHTGPGRYSAARIHGIRMQVKPAKALLALDLLIKRASKRHSGWRNLTVPVHPHMWRPPLRFVVLAECSLCKE